MCARLARVVAKYWMQNSSWHTQSGKSFVEASTQVLVLGTLHHFHISLFCLVAWVKNFLSTTHPLHWAFNHIGHPPWVPQSLQENQIPVASHPCPPTLYMSAGPLCFWKDFICFIALPPWTHTSDHIHPISHSFIIPFPLPLPLGHFKTHIDICNSIVGPQDPWCCCHSRAGYNFGRNFYPLFCSVFFPFHSQ